MADQIGRAAMSHAAALMFYMAVSWVVIAHGQPPTHTIWGEGTDPEQFIWFLAWFPYALSHHLTPFYTHLLWQPVGVNLAWATSVPALAALFLPVTVLAGPVTCLNLLTWAAPATAAAAAYALCFYLTRRWGPACLGGFLFGFSGYEMAQSTQHLNLSVTVCVPLLVLLALARLDGALDRRWFIALLALLLVIQFAISLELFATGLFFAALAWLLGWVMHPARRPGLRRLAGDTLCAAPFAALLVSPLIWAMAAYPHSVSLPTLWPVFNATDPLNLILPTGTEAIGASLAHPITRHFAGFPAEQDGYLGLPLLVIAALHGRYLAALTGVTILLSLGPVLWLDGTPSPVPLPCMLFWHVPLIGNALPARFMLFAALAASLAACHWVAVAPRPHYHWRLACGAQAALALLPAPHKGQPVPASAFFAPGRVFATLGPNQVLLLLPFGVYGHAAYWQAAAGFSFTQTAGYLGFPPAWAQPDTALMRFYFRMKPGLSEDFAAYCEHSHTGFVVAGPGTPPDQLAALYRLGWPARPVDDVVIFTVPHG